MYWCGFYINYLCEVSMSFYVNSYVGMTSMILTSAWRPWFLRRCDVHDSYVGVTSMILTSAWRQWFLRRCDVNDSYVGVTSMILTSAWRQWFLHRRDVNAVTYYITVYINLHRLRSVETKYIMTWFWRVIKGYIHTVQYQLLLEQPCVR